MKKNFKKSIVFIIILALILSLTACGSDKKEDTVSDKNTTADSGDKGAKVGTLKPGDEVPDGDKPAMAAEGEYHALTESKMSYSVKDSGTLGVYGDDGDYGDYIVTDVYDGADIPGDLIDPVKPIIWDPDEPLPTAAPVIQPKAGLLTAGEWNDNKNFEFVRLILC